jgi:hypothetical protein
VCHGEDVFLCPDAEGGGDSDCRTRSLVCESTQAPIRSGHCATWIQEALNAPDHDERPGPSDTPGFRRAEVIECLKSSIRSPHGDTDSPVDALRRTRRRSQFGRLSAPKRGTFLEFIPTATLVQSSVGPSIHSQMLTKSISSTLTYCVMSSRGSVSEARPLSVSRRLAARCSQPRGMLSPSTTKGSHHGKDFAVVSSSRRDRHRSAMGRIAGRPQQ